MRKVDTVVLLICHSLDIFQMVLLFLQKLIEFLIHTLRFIHIFFVSKVEELGWGNPMGGMFASIRDMATYMSFLFRTNQKAGGNQILDGFTIMEFLQPVMLTHDGTAGFNFFFSFLEFSFFVMIHRIWNTMGV